jgi:hypothetical protein
MVGFRRRPNVGFSRGMQSTNTITLLTSSLLTTSKGLEACSFCFNAFTTGQHHCHRQHKFQTFRPVDGSRQPS